MCKFKYFLTFVFVIMSSAMALDKVPRETISVSGKVDLKIPSTFNVDFLESLKVTSALVFDPYQKNQKFKFEGVLLEDLFKYFSPKAAQVKVTAINGYQVLIKRDSPRAPTLMFAFKSDGNYISVKKMGPLRIIRTDVGKITDQELILEGIDWVWMVKEIIFE